MDTLLTEPNILVLDLLLCRALKKGEHEVWKLVGVAWIKIIMTYLDINTDNVHTDCQNTNNGWLVDNAHTKVYI